MIRVVRQPARRPQQAGARALRSPTARQTPNSAYNTSGRWPISQTLMLDGRYTAPPDTDQALFLQRADVPMVFIVAMVPAPGATGVNTAEEIRAHLIKSYSDLDTIKAFVNGVERDLVTTSATVGGLFAVVASGGAELVNDVDGVAHIRIEGEEDVAGDQVEEWTAAIKARPPLSKSASGKVPLAFALLQAATGRVPVPKQTAHGAGGRVPVRVSGFIHGEAAGRIFVGELFIFADAAGSVNIAEVFRDGEAGGSVTIRGYALEDGAAGSLEILGAALGTDAAGSVNLFAKIVEAEGAGSLNIGILAQSADAGGSVDVWGETSARNLGRLVLRVQPLSAEMITELVRAGVRFSYETCFVKIEATVSMELELS